MRWQPELRAEMLREAQDRAKASSPPHRAGAAERDAGVGATQLAAGLFPAVRGGGGFGGLNCADHTVQIFAGGRPAAMVLSYIPRRVAVSGVNL